jgi:hypothetical protein
MSAVKNIIATKIEHEKVGHVVIAPGNLERHLAKKFTSDESTNEKIKDDLIRGYFEKIKNSNAVLVINNDKNGITNYIGGNTFLEMGFAHALSKKIFLLHSVPEISYKDEIIAMQPVVLDGDLTRIK